MPRRQNVLTVIDSEEADILRLNHRVLEESPDLVAIIGTDYRYSYVNPVYAKIHLRKQKDFVGAHARKLVRGVAAGDGVGLDVGSDIKNSMVLSWSGSAIWPRALVNPNLCGHSHPRRGVVEPKVVGGGEDARPPRGLLFDPLLAVCTRL